MKLAYFKAYRNALTQYLKDVKNRDKKKRFIFNGVRYAAQKNELYKTRREDEFSSLLEPLITFIGELTPNEFMNIFPITKMYDGERWGIKDYFYTMDFINKLDRDKAINEQMDTPEFVFEYENKLIRSFAVELIHCLNECRKNQGHIDMIEEFFASQGTETPNTFRNAKNEPMYVLNGKPKKITIVDKKRHLSLIGGSTL